MTGTVAGRRLMVAALVSILGFGLVGCSHSASPAAHPQAAAASASSAAPSAAPSTFDPKAAKARDEALAAMRVLRSYSFASSARLGSDTTDVQGRVILPSTLTYVITKSSKQEQVIRIATVTYVRTLPGTWLKLARASSAASPLQGLLAALAATSGLKLDKSGGTLTGNLLAADATRAGLIKSGTSTQPASVVFRLDRAHRVTMFTLTTGLSTAARALALTTTTSYGAFNTTAAITAP